MKYKLTISGEAKFGLMVVFGLCLIYYMLTSSPWAQVARQNVLNSEQVRTGITEKEVLQIMGEPDRIDSYGPSDVKWWTQQGVKNYHYRPSALASDGIDIWMDATGAVVHITYFGH